MIRILPASIDIQAWSCPLGIDGTWKVMQYGLLILRILSRVMTIDYCFSDQVHYVLFTMHISKKVPL